MRVPDGWSTQIAAGPSRLAGWNLALISGLRINQFVSTMQLALCIHSDNVPGMEEQAGPTVRKRRRLRIEAPALVPLDMAIKAPLEQQVYARLRNALMEGRVPAGTAVSVRSLSEALNVGKTPVRDALKRLESDGVLQSRPRSAFWTAPLSLEEYDAILAVRLNLEGWAAAEAARMAGPDDHQAIQAAADRYLALGSQTTSQMLSAANHAFHFAIYRAAGNPILLDLISNLWVRMGPLLARIPPGGAIGANASHHVRASVAILSGDSEGARAAIHEDLGSAAREIRRTIVALTQEAATGNPL